MFFLINKNRFNCDLDINAPVCVLNNQKVSGRDVCANSSPFSDGGERFGFIYVRRFRRARSE